MPRVRFLKTIEGTAQNRAGNAAGSEAWVSDAEAERLLVDDAIELLDDDPGPGEAPVAAPANPLTDQE
jgi:hypothetical protein